MWVAQGSFHSKHMYTAGAWPRSEDNGVLGNSLIPVAKTPPLTFIPPVPGAETPTL